MTMMAPLDPDVMAAIQQMRLAGRPRIEALDVAAARALYRAGQDTLQLAPIALRAVEDFVLAGRPARRFVPADAASGTILFFHGGGYVIGDLDTHDSICRHLAAAAGASVVSLAYRLAPEHPFPAAFEDAAAACRELADCTPVALAGDSAGGAIAIATALAGIDVRPAGLALFYPVTDVSREWPSYATVGDVPVAADTMRWFWFHALATAPRADARLSPLHADGLERLPPTFLATAGHDPLCDEGMRFAERLREAGVTLSHHHLPGQIHGYLTLGRIIGEAERSLAAAGRFLADCLEAAIGRAPSPRPPPRVRSRSQGCI